MLLGRLGSNLPVGVQKGEHTVNELAHQAAVVGQLVALDEAVVELGAELLGHGELVAQVVVAGFVGQTVGGGLQVLRVIRRPAARIRHGGEGVGRGVPQVFVGQQRLLVLEMPVSSVEERLGCLGSMLSEHHE